MKLAKSIPTLRPIRIGTKAMTTYPIILMKIAGPLFLMTIMAMFFKTVGIDSMTMLAKAMKRFLGFVMHLKMLSKILNSLPLALHHALRHLLPGRGWLLMAKRICGKLGHQCREAI